MEGTTGENAISSARAASSTSSSTPDSQALAFAVAALQALPTQEERWSPPRQRVTPRVVSSKPLPQLPRSATQAALRKKPAVPRLFFPTKQPQPPVLLEEQQRKDHEEHQATSSGSAPLPAPLFAPLFSSFPSTSAVVSGQQQAYPVLVAASPFPSGAPPDLKSYAGAATNTTSAAKKEPNEATDLPEDDDGHGEDDDHDEAARLQRSRERNREHARRTRLRKKAALQELQNKIARLKATKASLQQQIQDQSIASILLGLNNNGSATEEGLASAETTRTTTPVLDHETEGQLHGGGGGNKNKRKRSSSSSLGATSATQKPLQVRIAGKGVVTIQSQVNWKTGTYMDEAGMTQKLTPEELELLRCVQVVLCFCLVVVVVWLFHFVRSH